MENYIVSARKYRPITFDTVVGQTSITNTLKNAIKNNHLAQAFLFCGPRGVGKTTCARILAKTINCRQISEKFEACDVCESCLSFNNSSSFNIYELDAASNNSVEDIRSLVDQVRIPPQDGKYKVYIIDEVHMLSQSAFNAFLKTLEEPPAYAKFILATTEKHKIIPTILSRCQIFDFKRIKIEDIAHHLAYVAEKENITADADALHIIAQKADGALRDALSIFDQLVSFAGQHLTYQAVIENLNVLDYDYYFKLTDYFLQNEIPDSLLLFNEVIEKGFDGQHFIIGLGEHLRNLLVCKDVATIKLMEIGESLKVKYNEQALKCSVPFLFKSLEIINQCDLNYKISNNKRLSIEIMLMQISSLNQTNPGTEPSKKHEILTTKQDVKPKIEANLPIVEVAKHEETSGQPELKVEEVKAIPVKKAETYSNISVKEMMNVGLSDKAKNTSETTATVHEPETQYEITQQDFDLIWSEYLVSIQLNSPSLYVTLSKNKPTIIENTINLTIDNKIQETEIKHKKGEMLEFLRMKSGNKALQIETQIIAIEKANDIAYTDNDKFKKMAEKNPDIIRLKDELNLELEF
ncbi:MAG: DNA polymerase III subunit gamma/tau [Bacteroidetes bacterium]|nr:DNA polymerase III subunit gamma/tau [Bacteroidota bacterium]